MFVERRGGRIEVGRWLLWAWRRGRGGSNLGFVCCGVLWASFGRVVVVLRKDEGNGEAVELELEPRQQGQRYLV
jgi:hypothetical protein